MSDETGYEGSAERAKAAAVARRQSEAATVEQALGEFGETEATGVTIRPTSASPGPVTPAPAERFRGQPGPNIENIRSSAQAKRGVHPIPKKGKP